MKEGYLRQMSAPPSYLLVTPVKNEEDNIAKLVSSVDAQSLRPAIWVIVDDNSTDRGPEILKAMEKGHSYLRVVRFPEKKEWDIGIHYSEVCSYGFKSAMDIAGKEGIEYSHIALLDADMTLDPEYFKSLISIMEERRLDIASGVVHSWNGNEYIPERTREDLPRGGARVWKRECFLSTGGYLPTYSPDSVSNVKAKLRGCRIGIVNEVKAYQSRQTSSAMGRWTGFKKGGISAYYRHYPIHAALMRAGFISIDRGMTEGLAFMIGYFTAWVNRYPRLDDDEIREYNRKKAKDMLGYWMR